MKTLHIGLLIVTLFAQETDVADLPLADDRIARLEERVKELEVLIERLTLKTPAAESADDNARYAKFKQLQTDGAIVRIAPADGLTRESTLPLEIAFFQIPTDALAIGMNRADALTLLRAAQATDMIFYRDTRSLWPPVYDFGPTDDPSIVKQRAIESERVNAIPGTEEYRETCWSHPRVGRFELHFTNNRLDSIVRWRGAEDESVERLVLDN